jgi:hypothetical protein
VKPARRVRVSVGMRSLVFLALVACGGKQTPAGGGGSGEPVGVVKDTRSEIEKRRDAGCTKLRPRLVQCAVDDTKADLDAGKIDKKQFDLDTAPEWQEKLGAKWMKECRVNMSSRQVRVLEVCDQEESQCGPLLDCLQHLNDKSK